MPSSLLRAPRLRISNTNTAFRQSVAAILEGEPLMLNAAGHEFPGIYTRARTEPERGAAIILHGRDMHPDGEQVAGPLRKTLPAHAQLVPCWYSSTASRHSAGFRAQTIITAAAKPSSVR